MGFFTAKKVFALGVIIALLAAIPVAVYLLQQQQETRSQATKSTTLSLTPASVQTKVNDKFKVDVMIDPGSNQIMNVLLNITYDQAKIATATAENSCGASICPTSAFPLVSDLSFTDGNIYIRLGTGSDVTKFITTPTKLATITFQAKTTTGTTPTQIAFGNYTNVTPSLSGNDTETNVLSTTNPANVDIAPTSSNPSITVIPSPTSATSTGSAASNNLPICSSLNVDRSPNGNAPFSITFTANGSDTDGTLVKATFDFGDGPVQDVMQSSSGDGKTASMQLAHTYRNAGTYKASTTFTDNNGGVSAANSSCSQTITVNAASGAGGSSGTTTASQTATAPITTTALKASPTTAALVSVTTAPPGPGNTIITAGLIGAVFSILGAVLFLTL